jgi:hypothetical protein
VRFDLTNLSAGQIALLTALATLIAATINAIGAAVTAWVNGRSARRLEYMKMVQATKAKQARLIRRRLNVEMTYWLKLVATGRKLPPSADIDSAPPMMLPMFLAGDRLAGKLSQALGSQSKAVKRMVRESPEQLSPDTIAELRHLIQTVGVFLGYLELSVLRPAADPTRYLWRVRMEAWLITRGRYLKFSFRPPGSKRN